LIFTFSRHLHQNMEIQSSPQTPLMTISERFLCAGSASQQSTAHRTSWGIKSDGNSTISSGFRLKGNQPQGFRPFVAAVPFTSGGCCRTKFINKFHPTIIVPFDLPCQKALKTSWWNDQLCRTSRLVNHRFRFSGVSENPLKSISPTYYRKYVIFNQWQQMIWRRKVERELSHLNCRPMSKSNSVEFGKINNFNLLCIRKSLICIIQ
jgi:hypothetical protein